MITVLNEVEEIQGNPHPNELRKKILGDLASKFNNAICLFKTDEEVIVIIRDDSVNLSFELKTETEKEEVRLREFIADLRF